MSRILVLACIACSQCVNEYGININIKQIQIKREQIKHTSYDNNNQNIINEYLTTKTTKANIDKLAYKLYFVHQNHWPKSFAKTNNINNFSYMNNSDEFNIFNNFDKNALYFNLNFSENNNNFLNKTKRFFKLSFIKNNVSKKLFNIKLLEPNQSITIQKPKTKRLSIRELIKQAESKQNIPSGLLKAIGLVESRLQPYCINYNGRGYSFKTKSEAVKFINDLIRKGETNFSVGCFQLHYKSHANKFRSVNEMLDPARNVEYAANLLKNLYKYYDYQWSNAVKKYNPGDSYYYNKIMNKFGRFI